MQRLLEHLPLTGSETQAKHVLGLMVTSRALHGVLLERSETGTKVVRRLSRQRSGDYGGDDSFGDFEGTDTPGLDDESSGEDFTIQFDEGAGGDDLFLGSEFGDLDLDDAIGEGDGNAAASPDFVLELRDLLAECRDAGYEDPAIAFCLAAADVKQLELHVPDAAQDDESSVPSVDDVGRKKLLNLLASQYEGEVDKERVAFLPMVPTEEGVPRFLVLIGRSTDPVVTTLRTLRNQKSERFPVVRQIETEISTYLALARSAQREAATAQENTLIVRAGAEDTLALFMRGGTLRHSETLRSLTAFDAPETICSRVLLLQDEYGIGEVGQVFLVGAAHEENLLESFEMFFSDARVEPLRQYLPPEAEEMLEGADYAVIPGMGAALHLTGHSGFRQFFDGVNLLPKGLARRRLQMPVSWHVPALYLVLFIATFFFVARYFSMERKISDAREELRQYPEEVDMSPKALQARIDSLENVRISYMRGLETLDVLLKGSDQWSQALAEISNETAAVQGVWVDGWRPQGQTVQLAGNATSRDRIVRLAERTEGTIQQVSFSEIREWPIYSFTMDVPLETGLPAATRYLRQQMAEAEAQAAEGEVGPPTTPAALENDDE